MNSLTFDGVRGLDFLLIYVGLCAGLWLVARGLAFLLRRPSGDAVGVSLGREAVAFLAGGPTRTLAAAFGSLLDAGTLRLEAAPGCPGLRQARANGPMPPLPTPLQRALAKEATDVPLDRSVLARLRRLPEMDAIRESLEDDGLILHPGAARAARVWPALVLGLAVPLAIPRLVLAFERDRPVGILIVLMFAVVMLVAKELFVGSVVRTRRGDAVLARRAQRLRASGATALLADHVALDGAGISPALRSVFQVHVDWSDGGGGDGGCGGGGCGGCGGCGG